MLLFISLNAQESLIQLGTAEWFKRFIPVLFENSEEVNSTETPNTSNNSQLCRPHKAQWKENGVHYKEGDKLSRPEEVWLKDMIYTQQILLHAAAVDYLGFE